MTLYDQITSWDNLRLAYKKAAKGKRGKGPAARFEYRLEDNLAALQRELLNKSYQPGQYASFYIHEPKRRLISAAPFRDRVVHHALCNLIEPIFERSFIEDSYANRVGKGTHRALDRCQTFARRFPYVLTCDLKQYFPSIDHQILRRILARKINCLDTLWLIDGILASGIGVLAEEYEMVWFPDDDLLAATRPRGLPIGNLTSQFWANCYLNDFDHFVKRILRCRGYVRFVDDFLLFAADKATLRQWRESVTGYLAQLRLTLHLNKAQIRPVSEGIPFLGFVVYPQRRRVKGRKVVHFRRRLRQRLADYRARRISLDQVDSSVQGWVNHVRYGNTVALRRVTFDSLPIVAPG
ncbi:MAG: RNA-dependent DNA polymerase [Anaerolineae bacterium]|nr:RNA-dependent DNA polymerase [Anaerolineales bacterium]MCQ3977216.1 RNA-dependent DNA polymerase [Anaerolineae bacterium]